jgi:hypothetical protein
VENAANFIEQYQEGKLLRIAAMSLPVNIYNGPLYFRNGLSGKCGYGIAVQCKSLGIVRNTGLVRS